MSEEKYEEKRRLLTSFYDAMAEFDSDHQVIFGSDAERKRVHFSSLKRWGRAWSNRGRCMHNDCTKRSIAHSHTLSLASLRLIAENGHVMTPQFGKNGLELVPIGINEASTFPGFCVEHEGQFAGFEANKAITEPEHFRLQAYRTICRELYTKRHYRQRFEEGLAEHRLRREKFVVDRTAQALTRPTLLHVFGGLPFKNDPIEAGVSKALNSNRIDLLELERLYSGIVDDLQNGGNNITIMEFEFDMQLAVCLSGCSVLAYVANGVRKQGLCFLAILPEVGRTKIMLAAAAEHKDALRMVFRGQSSPAFLETLESWMIHCSDHWFMTPSAWAAIPHARRRAICDRIFESGSLVDRAPFSVLDGPRRYIVTFIEGQLASGAIPPEEITDAEEIIALERAKLDYVPLADAV